MTPREELEKKYHEQVALYNEAQRLADIHKRRSQALSLLMQHGTDEHCADALKALAPERVS